MHEEFSKIFYLYKDDIFRLAYSYTLNRSDAEDIVQNVFMKLYNNNKKIDASYLKKWLVKVTVNESKNILRSNWFKNVFKDNEKVNNYSELYSDKDVLDMLRKIPKPYRMVLHLYYFEGYSIKEISNLLHKNENTIKTHLRRAKKELKMEMEV